ncbi:MAG: HPr family phosphocarrier protein [Deltaproteobacteria bacterium]|nr:MAG: HPr family phosphocarrier protein [Deltaproteobacteria bacterium]
MRDSPQQEQRAVLEIRNKLGLHARAAKLIVETVTTYDADIKIAKDGQTVDGKSIMGIMMLAAEQGSRIEVTASGRQASEALEAIRQLVDGRFNEPE